MSPDPIHTGVQSAITMGLAGVSRAAVFDLHSDEDRSPLTDPHWNRQLLSGVAGSIALIVRMGMGPSAGGFGFDLITKGAADAVEKRRATVIARLMTTILNDDDATHDAVLRAVPDDEVPAIVDVALGFLRPTLTATVAKCALPGSERDVIGAFVRVLCGPFGTPELVDFLTDGGGV